MKRLVELLTILIPTCCFIAIGQTSTGTNMALAATFLMVSALLCSAIPKNSNTLSIWRQKYRSGVILLAFFVCLCNFFPIGGQISVPLLLEHSLESAQAIFVLASGATQAGDPGYSGLQRVTHGIKLLQQGRAPHLFISTGYSSARGHEEALWVASYTSMFSLPAASYTILISPEIVTTATEAAYAHKVLSRQKIDDILLVTSGAHIYRTVITFKKAGFTSIKPAPPHNRHNIYYANESFIGSFNAAMHEWIGLLYYWLKGYI